MIAELKGIHTAAETASGDIDLSVCVKALSNGIETLSTATDIVLNASEKDALSVATPYLNLAAHVISGAFLIKSVVNGMNAGDELAGSMATLARYHALSIMPQANASLEQLRAGASIVFDFPEAQLADL